VLAENEKWLSAVAGIVHVDSKLPKVGATCTRWLPDAGRPDKETIRHEFDSTFAEGGMVHVDN